MPTPSLLIVPSRFKSGKLYSQLPTSGAGDFTVTRATAATRVNASGLIQSVASGIPRLDYFASGGTVGCPALLVEPSVTNGILNSADTTTSWTIVSSTLASASIDVIGVSGNNLTVLVTGTTIAGSGRIVRGSNNIALASGSTYTISFFVKQTAGHTIGGYYAVTTGAASGDIGASFNVSGSFSSGSIKDNASFTNRVRRVERWGTDVYRCSETFTMSASGTLTNFHLAPLVSTTSISNSAVGTQLGFAAPQLELGSVPTSFIPTTTGSVTRNADVVSVSGAVSGSIGQTEGTIYIETNKLMDATLERFFSIYSSASPTNDNITISKTTGNTINFGIRKNNVLSTYAANFSGTVLKFACAFNTASGGVAIYVNGTQLLIDTNSGSFASVLNEVYIGRLRPSVNTDNLYNGRIRAVALYTTRLTNAELAALTLYTTSLTNAELAALTSP